MKKPHINKMKKPHINKIDNVRQFRLGTRFEVSDGGCFQYGKIDFGVGRILYEWLPVNTAARALHLINPPHRFMEFLSKEQAG